MLGWFELNGAQFNLNWFVARADGAVVAMTAEQALPTLVGGYLGNDAVLVIDDTGVITASVGPLDFRGAATFAADGSWSIAHPNVYSGSAVQFPGTLAITGTITPAGRVTVNLPRPPYDANSVPIPFVLESTRGKGAVPPLTLAAAAANYYEPMTTGPSSFISNVTFVHLDAAGHISVTLRAYIAVPNFDVGCASVGGTVVVADAQSNLLRGTVKLPGLPTCYGGSTAEVPVLAFLRTDGYTIMSALVVGPDGAIMRAAGHR